MKLDLRRLFPQQSANLHAALTAYEKGELVSSAHPAVLYLELTQNCVARCSFCRRWWRNEPRFVMEKELFEILLRDYIPYAALVDLRGWGESLMLPDFANIVRQVARCGPKIRLSTTLGCGRADALQALVDHDVFVSVSFDCAEKKLYEKIRRGISFDTVIKNLDFLIEQLKKKHILQDNLRLAVMPLQSCTLGSLESVVRFAAQRGISEVVTDVLSARAYHSGLLQYHRKETLRALQAAAQAARQTGVTLRLCSAPFEGLLLEGHSFDRCCHPWLYMYVNYRGNTIACDHMMRPSCERYAFGNLLMSPQKLWNGPAAQAMRKAHLSKDARGLPGMCRSKCYGLGRYADHEHEIDERFSRWIVDQNDLIDCSALRQGKRAL